MRLWSDYSASGIGLALVAAVKGEPMRHDFPPNLA